jgi:hypothetical protein
MRRTSTLLALLPLAACAGAQVVWDESVNGDLSGDRFNPTNVALLPGVNGVIATSVSGDVEYVHFTVPAGFAISQVNLVSWSGLDNLGFLAVQAGAVFTEPPVGTVVANLLGYSHYGPNGGGLIDYLPRMAVSGGAIGFIPPLSGPDYTFWINQTGGNAVTYRLDFVVGAAPSRFSPSSFLTVRGNNTGGNLASLAANDGNALRHCKFLVPNQLVPPVEVRVDAAGAVAAPSVVAAVVRGAMASSGSFSHGVELFDWVAGAYGDGGSAAVTTSESIVTATSSGAAGRYVGAGGSLRARYTVVKTGPSSVATWCYNADEFVWLVYP